MQRERDPNSLLAPQNVAAIILIGVVFAAGAIAWGSLKLGMAWAGTTADVPNNPLNLLLLLFAGRILWPREATYSAGIIAAAVVLLTIGVLVPVTRLRSRRTRVDPASRHLGRGRDIAATSKTSVVATAQRLGVIADNPGVFLGQTVASGADVFGAYEDMIVDIAGPRTGKTTSLAVPVIADAPGAVIVTSNKRDILDATRGLREGDDEVWVFDPQQVAAEQPTWWWNPLSYVVDDDTARELAQHFAYASRPADARADAFFDNAGLQLLAGLLLAGARGGHPVSRVHSWLTNVNSTQPEQLLRDHGDITMAEAVEAIRTAPERQRGGVFGTAQQMASCLGSSRIAPWVNPRPAPRPEFNPHHFVRRGGTLYSLSREGAGNAGPLVTALTAALVKAAEDYATTRPGGRLPVPMIGVLDEAANVCRWKDLPDLYSHYGSRGIVLITILQSWAQGVGCWGERGMEKLWSAANRRIYGGGVDDAAFLDRLSKLIGDRELLRSSTSTSKQGTSVNRQLQREQILDIAELAALPAGRAIVFSSGVACDPDQVDPLDGPAVRRPRPRLPRAARPRRTERHQPDHRADRRALVTLPDTEWDDPAYGDDAHVAPEDAGPVDRRRFGRRSAASVASGT
ncbi:TraM recognition domain-containing protein [Kribbella sp. NBC_01484]|uniref:type IV secretory system conjugative DNA transfer family protein n=1 Tax=Kribbella sp. NBC_01484 TaxID=2903579 RepID=UPI002E318885|nr:TraM recognition domain-containing protein [Kribbella sp. NBC_01484]